MRGPTVADLQCAHGTFEAAVQIGRMFDMTDRATPEQSRADPSSWLGDARHLPWSDSSVDCIVTSPPYWGQRDYGHADQIGLESTWVDYIDNLMLVAAEMRRVLRPDGTLWLNLGDTFNTRAIIRPSSHQGGLGHDNESIRLTWSQARDLGLVRYSARQPGLKDKDLMGLPWRVANAFVEQGWYLRADIIWSKPWCAPENGLDRPRRMSTCSCSRRMSAAATDVPMRSSMARSGRSPRVPREPSTPQGSLTSWCDAASSRPPLSVMSWLIRSAARAPLLALLGRLIASAGRSIFGRGSPRLLAPLKTCGRSCRS